MSRYPDQIKLRGARGGRDRAGRRRRAGDVRRGDPGPDRAWSCRCSAATRSRMATAVALSHGMFEGALLLGICDKIVPGLLIGALRFRPSAGDPRPGRADALRPAQQGKGAHPPALCRGQSGPRRTARKRERPRYHRPGTCTFYGTANSNQMMMEMMGLHLPGAAFVHPGHPAAPGTDPRRHRTASPRSPGTATNYRPLGACVDEKAIVNAIVGLLATGGSTNHAIHLPAIARAAGIADRLGGLRLSVQRVPLIARIYPNGCGRHEPFPAGRRHGFRDRRTARRRPAPSRHCDGGGGRPCALTRMSR